MDLTRYQLDNGINVILHANSAAPVVACNVWIGVGSADETPEEAGLAHVHEHMLFKGTERRGVGEIAREVEAAGGHINAFTSFDQTCYYVAMSSRYLDTGLDILSDAVRRSSFDAEELEAELEVIQEEIKRGKDNLARMAALELYATAYRDHPYRLPVIGTEESVDSFGRDHVVSFFERHYVPSNMTVVLVGDFTLDEARERIEVYFGDFTGPSYERRGRSEELDQSGVRYTEMAEEMQQTHLRTGFHIPNILHEDVPSLDLLGVVMGHGDASHLYQEIQRRRELVKGIGASTFTPRDPGMFGVSADYQLEDERTHEDVLEAILEEVFRFCDEEVAEVDLERARTIIESQKIYGRETVERLAMKLGYYEMLTGDPDFEHRYYERLDAVDAADLRRVAETYLTPENLSVVLMHPEGQSAPDRDGIEALARRARERADRVEREVHSLAIPEPPPRGREGAGGTLDLDDMNFYRAEIEGGPTLIVQEDHSVEAFSMRALSLGGLRFENAEDNGIGSLLSELITQGTAHRDAESIARQIESMAGSIGGISGRNSFGLSMTGLSRFFDPCLDLFAECLLESTIPDEEFALHRRLQLQHIQARRDKLAAVNLDQFYRTFFNPHPYAMPVDGTEESVSSLTVGQVRAFYERLVDPRRMVLAVVGDVDAARVRERVETLFTRAVAGESSELPAPPANEEQGRPRVVTDDMDKNQAHIIVGFPGSPLDARSRYAQSVLYAVLSGQGGRLFYELRDRQSLAYSVYARSLFGLDNGAFTISIGTSPEKIDQAVEGIFEQVGRLRSESVTGEEIERAKRYLIGNHDVGLQRNGSRAMSVGLDELYGQGFRRSMEFGSYIEEIVGDDIDAWIAEYLDPQRAVVSIVKPEEVEVGPSITGLQ